MAVVQGFWNGGSWDARVLRLCEWACILRYRATAAVSCQSGNQRVFRGIGLDDPLESQYVPIHANQPQITKTVALTTCPACRAFFVVSASIWFPGLCTAGYGCHDFRDTAVTLAGHSCHILGCSCRRPIRGRKNSGHVRGMFFDFASFSIAPYKKKYKGNWLRGVAVEVLLPCGVALATASASLAEPRALIFLRTHWRASAPSTQRAASAARRPITSPLRIASSRKGLNNPKKECLPSRLRKSEPPDGRREEPGFLCLRPFLRALRSVEQGDAHGQFGLGSY